jgi:hypothetical protein
MQTATISVMDRFGTTDGFRAGEAPALPVTRLRSMAFVCGVAATLTSFAAESLILEVGTPGDRPGWVGALRIAVLAAPFLGAVALLRLRRKGHRWARWLSFGSGAASVWVLLLALFLWPTLSERLSRRSFDAAAWRADSDGGRGVRQRMVDDLLSSGRLDGLTRAQVLDLLGPPDSSGAGSLEYVTGDERGFVRIDSEILVVEVGRDATVTRAWLRTD